MLNYARAFLPCFLWEACPTLLVWLYIRQHPYHIYILSYTQMKGYTALTPSCKINPRSLRRKRQQII